MIARLIGGPLDGLQVDVEPGSASVTCALPHRTATYLRNKFPAHDGWRFDYEAEVHEKTG